MRQPSIRCHEQPGCLVRVAPDSNRAYSLVNNYHLPRTQQAAHTYSPYTKNQRFNQSMPILKAYTKNKLANGITAVSTARNAYTWCAINLACTQSRKRLCLLRHARQFKTPNSVTNQCRRNHMYACHSLNNLANGIAQSTALNLATFQEKHGVHSRGNTHHFRGVNITTIIKVCKWRNPAGSKDRSIHSFLLQLI